MRETWTEYVVQQADGSVLFCPGDTLSDVQGLVREGEHIVGRTVTASDWLPVWLAATIAADTIRAYRNDRRDARDVKRGVL